MLSSFLLIGLLLFAGLFLYRMLQRSQPSPASRPTYAGASTPPPAPRVFEVQQPIARQATSGPVSVTGEPLRPLTPASGADASASTATWSVPADFDVEGFLRSAKVYFVRLQAAWDAGDQADIREFTTPEMYAEIKVDLAERGATPNQTDVVELDAELLGIEEQGRNALASVRFHGLLRETPGTPAAPFSEVWNLVKPLSGKHGWLLAGIQQMEPA
jgi:predicted lipid-binding transport protein (Tim44 family)